MDSEQLELKDVNHTNGVPDYQTAPQGAEHHRVAASTAGKLRVAAVAVSWISVIFSFSTGVAAIVLGFVENSESLFGYGLDATLDSFSSVAVLWRFYGDASDLYSEQKERRACLVIGIFFIISGLMLTIKSVISIATKVHESTAVVLYTAFASTTGVVSVVLALVKVYLGYKLESAAMATDSIITFVGAAMSFAGVAGLELYVQNTHLWFMDSVFGIICGLFLVTFGIKVVYDARVKHKDGHDQLL